MVHKQSQQQMIYQRLLGQIRLGLYQNGMRFPSVNEIAEQYHVSYCPAQRALKALEKDNYIRLYRGRTAEVIWNTNESFLGSAAFWERAKALDDLQRGTVFLSPILHAQGLIQMDSAQLCHLEQLAGTDTIQALATSYQIFEESLRPLDNQSLLNLFYDIDAFSENVFWDIMRARCGPELDKAMSIINGILRSCIRCVQEKDYRGCKEQLSELCQWRIICFGKYLEQNPGQEEAPVQVPFHWEPQKGRDCYCDTIAIDLICRINQGIYPVGELLPNSDLLAKVYHVSGITVRRVITMLNKLEVVKSLNGVGTRVISRGDQSVPVKMKDTMLSKNLLLFLEALQFLAITSEEAILALFAYFTPEALGNIGNAVAHEQQRLSTVLTISSCLQAIINCSPFAVTREIYNRITLMLLNGSVLRLEDDPSEKIDWWPELAEQFSQGLRTQDAGLVAKSFARLTYNSFCSAKETLLEIGIDGAKEIATPILF